jgi:EAL domain-containing protein (putative c-di-GMP-specific phosphodiesterase class I)
VGSNILVVDDDPASCQWIGGVLTAAGHTVHPYTRARDALRHLEHRPIDLLLSDVVMPDLDGLELTRLVRDEAGELPVILVTGRPDLAIAARAVELRAHRFLAKPLDPTALVALVGACLEHRSALCVGPRAIAAAIGTLDLAFQPIVDALRVPVGLEVLARPKHARMPSPDLLFAAARALGLSGDVDLAVRDGVARALARRPTDLTIFLNVTPTTLLDERWYRSDPLLAHASRVVLELTETAPLPDDIESAATRVRRLGYRLALDDVGAGYASLAAFVRIAPEVVKIDRALIADLPDRPVQQRIVSMLARLTHESWAQVIAEGIETEAEAEAALRVGCDLLQGFHLGRPAGAMEGRSGRR